MPSIAGPVVRGLTGMPVPNKPVFDAAEELAGRLAELHDLLSDREISTVRLVVNPEKMVIKEAQRSFTYLNLYGYVTDAVVCNRVLPKAGRRQLLRALADGAAKVPPRDRGGVLAAAGPDSAAARA